MSEQEFHAGKVKKIEVEGKTWEDKVNYLKSKGYTIEDWDEEFIESDEVIYIHERKEFYEIIDHFEGDDYTAKAWKNNDNTINFVLSFYNGGTYFGEALGDALDKLDVKYKNKE